MKCRTVLSAFVATCMVLLFAVPMAYADTRTPDPSETTIVILLQDDDTLVTAEVPSAYASEYEHKLNDPEFRDAEVNKALRDAPGMRLRSSGLEPRVTYFGKKEMLRILANIDNRYNWMQYLNSWPSAAIIAEAGKLLTHSNLIGALFGAVSWLVSWIGEQHNSWWRESCILILQGKIHGVKMVLTPNYGSYPAVYRSLTRY